MHAHGANATSLSPGQITSKSSWTHDWAPCISLHLHGGHPFLADNKLVSGKLSKTHKDRLKSHQREDRFAETSVFAQTDGTEGIIGCDGYAIREACVT